MHSNSLAIIIAFYLSKFDKQALKNLGFKNNSEAFEIIAKRLGIKKNYIKFRRDEFDPVHPWRKGWRRPMDRRIIKSIEALQDIEEPELREIVQQILENPNYHESEEVNLITSFLSEGRTEKVAVGRFVLRAPTGRKAEECFIEFFRQHEKPVIGNLIDCRDLGVGYDFRIEAKEKNYFVEVKGISDFSGGVLFTGKEWSTARREGETYFLCIVSNLNEKAAIKFVQNPFKKLNAKKNIFTSIQINWSVTASQLSDFND